MFLGFLTPVLRQLFFQSHLLLFSHASAEMRGENTPERTFVSTGYQTHNHQVLSPTCSPLSHPGGPNCLVKGGKIIVQDYSSIPSFCDGFICYCIIAS